MIPKKISRILTKGSLILSGVFFCYCSWPLKFLQKFLLGLLQIFFIIPHGVHSEILQGVPSRTPIIYLYKSSSWDYTRSSFWTFFRSSIRFLPGVLSKFLLGHIWALNLKFSSGVPTDFPTVPREHFLNYSEIFIQNLHRNSVISQEFFQEFPSNFSRSFSLSSQETSSGFFWEFL